MFVLVVFCFYCFKDVEKLRKIKRWARLVSSKSDRKKALDADVIVTTSGMLDGGPAHWYLNRLRNDQRNAILLTGYQAENSGGRRLIFLNFSTSLIQSELSK